MVSATLKMKNLYDITTFHHIGRNKNMFERPFCFACISAWENDKILIFFQKMCRRKLNRSCMHKFLFENKKVFETFSDYAQYGEK